MAKNFDYYSFITSVHSLYQRYREDWKLAVRSFYGGVEYRDGRYLKQFAIDTSTPSDVINTYDVDDYGNQTGSYRTQVTTTNSRMYNATGGDVLSGTFYDEKIQQVPSLPYTRLYVSEYNSILFRTPPVRNLPDDPDVEAFIKNVSGEGESINEFMSMVDTFTTVYGVVWISCIKPAGAPYARWRMHSPLDVSNWQYSYTSAGDLELNRLVIQVSADTDVRVMQYYTKESIHTIFEPQHEDADLNIPPEAVFVPGESRDDLGLYVVVQDNPLGYIPVRPVYQSTKIYDGVGHTPIFDIAQIQRSIYGDSAEIYSAISYGSHPVTVIDEATLAQNNFNVGAEPGATIVVANSLNGQAAHTFEFKAPPLDSIGELRALIEQKIEKMNQVAMVRSDELIRASRSGAQIETYDSKLEAFVRKKATSLENAEAHSLWPMWFDWQDKVMPEDLTVSYNRLYSKRGVENEIDELNKLIDAYSRYTEVFGESISQLDEYATPAEAEARAAQMGGSGYHEYVEDDGTVLYMPMRSHAEYELKLKLLGEQNGDLREDLSEAIRNRLYQLIESSYSENSL